MEQNLATRVGEEVSQASQSTRANRTRARLIDAAIDEFAEHGFHNAKISGIVARAGVTQPSFYLYFKTKDAIHAHLVGRVRDELTAVIQDARIPAETDAASVRDKLIRAVELFLQYFLDNPRLARIGYFAGGDGAGIREEIVALVSHNIAFEQGAGYCRDDLDPVFVSQCYNGSLERLIRVYLLTGQYEARALAEMVADLFGYGSIPDQVRQGADAKRTRSR